MKTFKLILESVKDPDGFGQLLYALNIPENIHKQYFEYCEYASFELEIDENLQVVSGRILKIK